MKKGRASEAKESKADVNELSGWNSIDFNRDIELGDRIGGQNYL